MVEDRVEHVRCDEAPDQDPSDEGAELRHVDIEPSCSPNREREANHDSERHQDAERL